MLAHIKDKVRGAARFYEKGESNSALLAYLVVLLNRYDTLNDKAQVNLLKVLAEISPYVTSGDVDYLWSAVSTMLKANLPSPDSVTSLNAAVLEMLLYSYHFLASKVRRQLFPWSLVLATNSHTHIPPVASGVGNSLPWVNHR
jgi:hypothetical protein